MAPLRGTYGQMCDLQRQDIRPALGTGGAALSPAGDLRRALEREEGRRAAEPAYFYHTDHLGSTTLLTDSTGNVVQTISYLPYGEDWTEYNEMQRPDSLSLGQYRFNGKERDHETGFLYYSQRYYGIPYLPTWLSVDPMMDKYPGISPYAYCAWNPVRFVDPDGMEWDPSSLEILEQYKKAVEDALKGARTKQQQEEIQGALSELDALYKSNQMYHIEYGTPDGHNTKGGTSYDTENDWVSVVVSWDASTGDMAHELKHAYQFEVGELSFDSRSGSGAESHLYDITDEQAAYRRGNAFGNQIPKNLEWHEKFKRSNGGYYYPFLDPTYVKSPDRADGRKASRNSSLIHNAKTPLKSPLNIIYRYEGKTYRK